MLILVGLLLVLALTAATGYFVAQEFGYVAVERGRLEQRHAAGDDRSGRALRVTNRLSFMLSGAQLGITVTGLLVGFVAEPYLGRGLAEVFGDTGLSEAASISLAVALALAVSTVIQMVLGELAPKNLAIAHPEGVARALARSTLLYLMLFGPLIRLFDAAANRLLRRVGVEPVEELEAGATPEDLTHIVAGLQAEGSLDRRLLSLLDRGLDFRLRTAREVITPRTNVVGVLATDPCVRVVELLDTGHSRFPVYGPGGVDDVVGVVAIADLITVPAGQRATMPISRVCHDPLFLPDGLYLREVLDILRQERRQLACVVDEYGGFAGVVTLEDVAEELVGSILDEDDLPEAQARRHSDGSWLVPGRWRVDEVGDATGIRLPDSDLYETVSGLVMHVLGRVPVVGDELTVGEVRLRVTNVARHVPVAVELRAATPGEAPR